MIARNCIYPPLSLVAVMTIMTRPGLAEDSHKGSSPTYNLSVAFDLQANSLKGIAEIVFPEPTDIVVSTGNLLIMSAILNSNRVECNKGIRQGYAGNNDQGVFRGEKGKIETLRMQASFRERRGEQKTTGFTAPMSAYSKLDYSVDRLAAKYLNNRS